MTEIGTFWVVADQYNKIVYDTYQEAINMIGGWADDAVILRIVPQNEFYYDGLWSAEDWTESLAQTWFEELSEIDDVPPDAFLKFVGEAVQARKDAAEDPDGRWAKADAQYNEMVGK